MLPLVTEFSIILPEFSLILPEFSLILPEFPQFFKILGGCDTPPHPPSSDAPGNSIQTYPASLSNSFHGDPTDFPVELAVYGVIVKMITRGSDWELGWSIRLSTCNHLTWIVCVLAKTLNDRNHALMWRTRQAKFEHVRWRAKPIYLRSCGLFVHNYMQSEVIKNPSRVFHTWHTTRVKISQAITGLLAQQPCYSTVNVVQPCFNILFSAWRIDRGCSRMLEHAKRQTKISSFPDMFYHVWTWLLIYHDGSSNVVQVCSFIKPWTVCSNIAWTSLSTMFKLASWTMFKQKQAVCFHVCVWGHAFILWIHIHTIYKTIHYIYRSEIDLSQNLWGHSH